MKKHKWKKDSESHQSCENCTIHRDKVRQIWGGWQYYDSKKPWITTFARPECKAVVPKT